MIFKPSQLYSGIIELDVTCHIFELIYKKRKKKKWNGRELNARTQMSIALQQNLSDVMPQKRPLRQDMFQLLKKTLQVLFMFEFRKL